METNTNELTKCEEAKIHDRINRVVVVVIVFIREASRKQKKKKGVICWLQSKSSALRGKEEDSCYASKNACKRRSPQFYKKDDTYKQKNVLKTAE